MIRVFPRRTKWTPDDGLVFIGDPPLWRPENRSIPVRISCAFTWDTQEAERIYKEWSVYYDDVQIGGPAYDDAGADFEPGLFVKMGVTITSRGCPKRCPWCFVPHREGSIRELSIKEGWILQDNNLLACSVRHIEAVFDMLSSQSHPINFTGGLDKDFLKSYHKELFKHIKIDQLWLSCDNTHHLQQLSKMSAILEDIPRNKKRCYVLIGFDNESLGEAEQRLKNVWDLGFLPFAQIYRPHKRQLIDNLADWKKLARTWCRPAATKKRIKEIP